MSAARAISHAYFFLIGLVGVGLLPALIRSFELNFSLSHTRMGAILSASSLVMASGSVLSGIWYDRSGPRWVLGAALAVTAAGALMLWGAASAPAFAAALMLFHFGHGLGVPVNSLISQLYGSERARGLILMHGFQALGRLGAGGASRPTRAHDQGFDSTRQSETRYAICGVARHQWHASYGSGTVQADDGNRFSELEFDQTENLRAEAGHDRLLHYAGVDAEPIPELEFDQTLEW